MRHSFLLSLLTAIIIFAATTSAEAGIFGRLSVVWNGCNPCEQAACQPCEPIACQPCEVVAAACNPCDVACDPCNMACDYRPFRPFGGLFANLKARAAANCATGCEPCEMVACQPCEVVACDPCDPCGAGFHQPFRPFGGLFSNLKAKLAASACAPGCDPCEPVACDPCAACF